MTLTFAWEAVTAICAVLGVIGVGLALYVQKVVKEAVNDAVVRINGTYMRTEKCTLVHDNTLIRFTDLERRVERLEETS